MQHKMEDYKTILLFTKIATPHRVCGCMNILRNGNDNEDVTKAAVTLILLRLRDAWYS